MSTLQILDTFDRWRAERRALTLVTVYQTEGSTYSKAGHRILIADNNDYQGLVSGGCLEGDIAQQAGKVMQSGQCRTLTYDLRDEADGLWGLGIGCNGVIKVLLQPLTDDNNYEPFRAIARCQRSVHGGHCAIFVASDIPDQPIGGTFVSSDSGTSSWAIAEPRQKEIEQHCRNMSSDSQSELREVRDTDGGTIQILCAPIRPVPRLLVLGAGPDAVPLITMANTLGWFVTVADHRPGHIAHPGFADTTQTTCVEPQQLADTLALDEFSAALIMSHHLETDCTYLNQLAGSTIDYIGVLGPAERKNRLIAAMETPAPGFIQRLHGPVGLDIGAESPESIALSILAEIHQQWNRR
jgi:xanthine dehydrogenase accessory factor